MIATDILEKISTLSKIPKKELGLDTELYNSTVISSLSLLALMSYVEQKYSIVIRPEELYEDNFKDVKTLAGFIEQKVKNM